MATKPTFFETGPETVAPVRRVYDGEVPEYPEGNDGFRKNTKDTEEKKSRLANLNVNEALRIAKTDSYGRLIIDEDQAARQIRNLSTDTGNPLDRGTARQREGALESIGAKTDKPGAKILNAALSLSDKVQKITNKIKGTVDINGVKRLIETGDLNSANGVANILNTLAKGNLIKVEDITSKIAVISSLMDDMKEYGILNAVDYVMQTMDDIESKKRLLAKMVPAMFISADIKGLNTAIDILGAGRVMSLYPQGIQAFIAGFRTSYRTTTDQYPRIWNNVFKLFNRLNGTWALTDRNGTQINDLTGLISMSLRFYDVFKYIDHTKLNVNIYPTLSLTKEEQVTRFTEALLTAREYRRGDKHRLLSQLYPKASFSFRRQTR